MGESFGSVHIDHHNVHFTYLTILLVSCISVKMNKQENNSAFILDDIDLDITSWSYQHSIYMIEWMS